MQSHYTVHGLIYRNTILAVYTVTRVVYTKFCQLLTISIYILHIKHNIDYYRVNFVTKFA
jgi:hypothetical protein